MDRLLGERRALAAAFLAMYGFLYLLVTLQAPEGWGAAFGSLALIYGTGFLGVVAGYFWARWFVIGLGLSGVITGVLSMFQLRDIEPVMLFFATTHLAVAASLIGDGMAKTFDGRPEWRKRFHLDESATNKLGKSVIRLGISLPYVVLFALAPREDGSSLALIGGVAIIAGAWGVTRMRTWSLVALASGVLCLLVVTAAFPTLLSMTDNSHVNTNLLAWSAIGFTLSALIPFANPVWQAITGRLQPLP